MLVFVVPLKSKRLAGSWRRSEALLERTLRSICAQTSDAFRVIVVCHERPEIGFAHPHIRYVEVDFSVELTQPEPTADDSLTAMPDIERKRVDKGRKLLLGCTLAAEYGPDHVMIVDADDCVSNRLAEFASRSRSAAGWYIARGYSYQEGSSHVYLKRRDFHRECGTGNIVRYDLLQLPSAPEYNRGVPYYKLLLNHGLFATKISRLGEPLVALPFYGAIYTFNGENIFAMSRPARRGVLGVLKRLVNERPLTDAIRREFGLYAI